MRSGKVQFTAATKKNDKPSLGLNAFSSFTPRNSMSTLDQIREIRIASATSRTRLTRCEVLAFFNASSPRPLVLSQQLHLPLLLILLLSVSGLTNDVEALHTFSSTSSSCPAALDIRENFTFYSKLSILCTRSANCFTPLHTS